MVTPPMKPNPRPGDISGNVRRVPMDHRPGDQMLIVISEIDGWRNAVDMRWASIMFADQIARTGIGYLIEHPPRLPCTRHVLNRIMGWVDANQNNLEKLNNSDPKNTIIDDSDRNVTLLMSHNELFQLRQTIQRLGIRGLKTISNVLFETIVPANSRPYAFLNPPEDDHDHYGGAPCLVDRRTG